MFLHIEFFHNLNMVQHVHCDVNTFSIYFTSSKFEMFCEEEKWYEISSNIVPHILTSTSQKTCSCQSSDL